MKKNLILKVTFALLLVCVITTSLIGTTLAKYVSTGSNTNTARVAKWGVTITGGTKMFGNSYVNAAGGNTPATEGTLSVVAGNTDLVVAPGTEGTMGAFAITGTPEVSVRVTASATVDLGDNWKVGDAFYCPIVFTIVNAGVTQTIQQDATNNTPELLENAIMAAINSYTADFGPNVAITATNLTVSWEWAFNGNDANDTALGNAAAVGANVPTIIFNISLTATQID